MKRILTFWHRHENLAAGLFLAGLLLVFFSPALRPGHMLSPADGLFATPFFAMAAPEGFQQPANSLLFDQVYQFIPWRHYAWESLRQGHLPLWNPYSLCGTPFLATMQSAVFYPLNLLLTVLPFEQTFAWSAVLRLWLAGIGTYLAARRYLHSWSARMVAAVSFMLSGFLVTWLGSPHANVAIWLPWLILLADDVLDASSLEHRVRATALLALVIGVQFTGGHIETSVDILLAFILYYLLRWLQLLRRTGSSLRTKITYLILPPVGALLLGIGLAAIQLLPFFEWLPLSAELQDRSPTSFQWIAPSFWQQLLSLPVGVFPNLFNNPTWPYPYWSFLPGGFYNENTLYVGILTLLLALPTILAWKRDPLIRIWLLIGVLNLGRALRFPIFDWLNQIPGLNLGVAGRLRLVFAFSMCLLAGFGTQSLLEALQQGLTNPLKRWARLCSVVVVLGLLMALGGNLLLPLLRGYVTDYGRQQAYLEYARRSTHTHPLEYYYTQVDQMVAGLLAAFRVTNLAMYAPAILALAGLVVAAWTMRRTPGRTAIFRAVLLALVVIDLLTFGWGYNPVLAQDYFYPPTTLTRIMRQDDTLFRFTALRQDMIPDAQMMFGIAEIRGLDFPTAWYNQYMNLVPDRIPWLDYGIIFATANSPLLRVLNLKYVAAAQPETLQQTPGLRLIHQNGQIYLGEIVPAQPRSFMVYQAQAVESDAEAARLLKEDPERVFRQVLLSEAPTAPTLGGTEVSGGPTPQASVALLRYAPEETLWQVSTNLPGYLFSSDAYYPGWQAYLDGRGVPLYRANLAFRAVYVPPGDHVVAFRYQPLSVRFGVGITLSSALVLAFLFVYARCMRGGQTTSL